MRQHISTHTTEEVMSEMPDKTNVESINHMPASDLLSLYEDSFELGYEEMKEVIRLEFKRRSGEPITKHEIQAALDKIKNTGGTFIVCGQS